MADAPENRRDPARKLPPLNTLIADGRVKDSAPLDTALTRVAELVSDGRLRVPHESPLKFLPVPSTHQAHHAQRRQQIAADATAGCPFARFIEASGLADDLPDPPVRRNGKPY